MKIHETRIRVRHSETGLYSIAQHYVYPIWLQMAQEEYLKSLGAPYSEMEKRGIFFPHVETHIRFKTPALYDDELIIRTWIKEVGMVKAVFEFEIIREKDKMLIAKAEVTNAFMG